MAWNSSAFWPAFKRAGMLDIATFQPLNGPAFDADVEFRRPDQVLLDGMVHSTDYSIEYQAADLPLKRGDMVQILGAAYKVRQTPAAKGDGTFVIAQLEKVNP